jgi:hypothetical protein
MASELKARLDECLERDEQGRPRLTVTLPNEAALENLAGQWPRCSRREIVLIDARR